MKTPKEIQIDLVKVVLNGIVANHPDLQRSQMKIAAQMALDQANCVLEVLGIEIPT